MATNEELQQQMVLLESINDLIGQTNQLDAQQAALLARANLEAAKLSGNQAAVTRAAKEAARAAADLSRNIESANQKAIKAAAELERRQQAAASAIVRASAVAIAAIISLSAAADPGAFQQFKLALLDVGAAVGTILVPILNIFTTVLMRVNAWITNLSPAARAVIGVIVGLTVVVGLLTFAWGKLNAALVVFNSLTGGVLLIIGLIVAFLVGIAASSGKAEGSVSRLGAVMAKIGKVFEIVISKVIVVFEAIIYMIGEWWALLDQVAGWLITAFIDSVVNTFTMIADSITFATVALGVFYRRLREGELFSGGWIKEIEDRINDLNKAARNAQTTQAAQGAAQQIQVGEIFFKNFAAALGANYAQQTAENTAQVAQNSATTNTLLGSVVAGLTVLSGPFGLVAGYIASNINTSQASSSPLSLNWGMNNPWAGTGSSS